MTGKYKCEMLRHIRKQIAEANGIVYLSANCEKQKELCTGSCPLVEAEINWLNKELSRKAARKEKLTIKGLSLDLFDDFVLTNTTIPQNASPIPDMSNSSTTYEPANLDYAKIHSWALSWYRLIYKATQEPSYEAHAISKRLYDEMEKIGLLSQRSNNYVAQKRNELFANVADWHDAARFAEITESQDDIFVVAFIILYKWRTSSRDVFSIHYRDFFLAAFKHLDKLALQMIKKEATSNQRRSIDTHSHLLFGMDDGSNSMDMSAQMLRLYDEQGVTDVFCTSHSGCGLHDYHKNFDKLVHFIDERLIHLTIHCGCEIECHRNEMPQIVKRLKDGKIPTMANSEYILIEFEPYDDYEDIIYCVKYLCEHTSYKLIIAHVERYKKLQQNAGALCALKNMGCLFQINAYSLVEEQNPGTKAFAQKILMDKQVTFIGSDAHRINHRPPKVKSGINYIYSNCEREYADDICFRNAERLLLKRR